MENDILDALEDIGYTGPLLEEELLEKALDGGPKSLEYTGLVEWLSKELKTFCKLDEHVNAISSSEDSSSFLLELSSFLKELGCAYSSLMEGHMSERLHSRENRILLLDFLLTELEAARMIHVNKPDLSKTLEVQLNESSTASDLKTMLIALKFPKPPANITPALLFGKVEQKMKEVLDKACPELVGNPLFVGVLSDKQWHQLSELQKELQEEYHMRREMLIKRLDVTIQSFQWSERVKNQEDQIAALYRTRRKAMSASPDVHLSDLLAAREDLAIIEKTSSASVRRNTQSAINKVIIGRVPDRGGRPSEQQPPPPEMPSWQQQRPAGGGGGEEEEEDFKVETEEAEFKEDGIKGVVVVVVVVVIKTEVETIRVGVEDMEEAITVEVITRTGEAVIRVKGVVIRIEVVVTRIEGVVIRIEEELVVMEVAIRIEGVAEEGVLVVVAEGERITIDMFGLFLLLSV